MRVIADLHIHSRYSRATSERVCPEEIARFSRIKGLNLVGTGDFTHPQWLSELKQSLVPEPNASLYKLAGNREPSVSFMITTEVCTIFMSKNESKKIHHVVLTPTTETAAVCDRNNEHEYLSVPD